ncbi:MAG: hypothetical protein K5660_03640 [Paludibacteraceae bacterium]|nr:hypothetical protein [Paludibacteraceae bacterium]
MHSDTDILLNHSEQMDSLITAHLSELNTVLQDKQALRDALCRILAENKHLQEVIKDKDNTIAAKDNEIAQLRQRVSDLQKPTAVTSVAGNYIEAMSVANMNISSLPPANKSIKRFSYNRKKQLYSDQFQLPLWQTS